MKNFFVFFVFAFFQLSVEAKLWGNSYVSFEIPETWECKSFGTDWVCHTSLKKEKLEALITSTAKLAGPGDSLEQYQAYLEKEKTWSNIKEERITSQKLTPTEKVFINNFPWITSTHKNSEIKNYISRYVITVCCENSSTKLGILVVLSAHQNHFTKYSSDFIKAVNSLRVTDIQNAVEKIREFHGDTQSNQALREYMENIFTEDPESLILPSDTQSKEQPFNPTNWIAPVIIALAVITYLIIKMRRRKQTRRKIRRKKKK